MPSTPPRFRFSLRTLVLFVALCGSGYALWAHWEPWAYDWSPTGTVIPGVARPISDDGKRLLTIDDAFVSVWDLKSKKILFSLEHEQEVLDATYVQSDTQIATVQDDGHLCAWNARDGQLQHEIHAPGFAPEFTTTNWVQPTVRLSERDGRITCIAKPNRMLSGGLGTAWATDYSIWRWHPATAHIEKLDPALTNFDSDYWGQWKPKSSTVHTGRHLEVTPSTWGQTIEMLSSTGQRLTTIHISRIARMRRPAPKAESGDSAVDAALAWLARHQEPRFDRPEFALEGEAIVVSASGQVFIFRRRRPEWWYGIFQLWEFWLTLALTLALLWSVRRDWKSLGVAQPQGETP